MAQSQENIINVAYLHGSDKGHTCGYCKSKSGSFTYGFDTAKMKPEVYKSLMDCGWRRCGTYFYKPDLYKSCCKSYTIRMNALQYEMKKSQRKVLKKWNQFIYQNGNKNISMEKKNKFKQQDDENKDQKTKVNTKKIDYSQQDEQQIEIKYCILGLAQAFEVDRSLLVEKLKNSTILIEQLSFVKKEILDTFKILPSKCPKKGSYFTNFLQIFLAKNKEALQGTKPYVFVENCKEILKLHLDNFIKEYQSQIDTNGQIIFFEKYVNKNTSLCNIPVQMTSSKLSTDLKEEPEPKNQENVPSKSEINVKASISTSKIKDEKESKKQVEVEQKDKKHVDIEQKDKKQIDIEQKDKKQVDIEQKDKKKGEEEQKQNIDKSIGKELIQRNIQFVKKLKYYDEEKNNNMSEKQDKAQTFSCDSDKFTSSEIKKGRLTIKIQLAKADVQNFNMYIKYCNEVHGKSKETLDGFKSFLCEKNINFSIKVSETQKDQKLLLGCFHMNYYLDNEFIGVGVVDIFEDNLSSVYFYYDPKYQDYSLGVVASIYEIEYIQQLNKFFPKFQYYYLGYYIQNCQKMIYKGDYGPAELLCPRTYKWYPLDEKTRTFIDSKPKDPSLAPPQEAVDIKMSHTTNQKILQKFVEEKTRTSIQGQVIPSKQFFSFFNQSLKNSFYQIASVIDQNLYPTLLFDQSRK